MEQTARAERRDRLTRELARLWSVVLAPPIVWAIAFNLDYALVRVACTAQTMLPLHLVTLVALALTGWTALVAGRRLITMGGDGDTEGAGGASRTRFMLTLALLGSGFFSLAIIAQWLSKLFLDPCMAI